MRKWLACCAVALVLVARTGATASYTTTFPLTESPISEGANWTNGLSAGFDWSNVSTTPGLAFGTQTGVDGFNDSLAVLRGTWGPDQAATGTVYTVNQVAGDVFEEVEILLRFQITPHSARGYEINFSMRSDGAYTQIIRWDGPLGVYALLDSRAVPALQTGDQVAASIVGNTITTSINGAEIFHVTDNTFTDGNPGLGFYLQGATGVNGDYGFSCYSASDAGDVVPSCAASPSAQNGRLTGGGKVVMPAGPVTLAYELNCQPSIGHGNLEVTWNAGKFKLESLTSATCYQDPGIAGAPRGNGDKSQPAFNTYQGKGTGRLNNSPGASATWTLTDQGEPGSNDTVVIQIRDRDNVVVLTASGRLVGGNTQTHK